LGEQADFGHFTTRVIVLIFHCFPMVSGARLERTERKRRGISKSRMLFIKRQAQGNSITHYADEFEWALYNMDYLG
jgi:hypothetical protein